jgi:hypothetical protein
LYLSDISSYIDVEHVETFFFYKVKDKLFHPALPTTRSRHNTYWASVDWGSNVFLILVCYSSWLAKCSQIIFRGSQNKRMLSRVHAAVWSTLLLESLDPADPIILEVSVADRNAVYSLWQVPIG